MLASEDASQQQLHFLQSCGFGGLWRFAGPFTKQSVSTKNQKPRIQLSKLSYISNINHCLISLQYNLMGESSELFVNCLEAMVETCLPVEDPSAVPPSPKPCPLSSSLSSLTLGSPTDKGTGNNSFSSVFFLF